MEPTDGNVFAHAAWTYVETFTAKLLEKLDILDEHGALRPGVLRMVVSIAVESVDVHPDLSYGPFGNPAARDVQGDNLRTHACSLFEQPLLGSSARRGGLKARIWVGEARIALDEGILQTPMAAQE